MLKIPFPTHLKDLNPALAKVAIQQITRVTKILRVETLMFGAASMGCSAGSFYLYHKENRTEDEDNALFLSGLVAAVSLFVTTGIGSLYLRQKNFQALYLPQLEQIVAKGG